MDPAAPLIVAVATPTYGRVAVDGSDGKRYFADLSSFAAVYCFPKTDEAWRSVGIDAQGLALVWSSRFEVHIDQVVGLADKTEVVRESA